MGPVSPQMRIMRMAAAKAQALPSIFDERFAKNRKASLATQKKSRDFSCGLTVSFCMVIILWFATHEPEANPVARRRGAAHQAAPRIAGPLTTEDQTEHETDSERGKDCLRRVLADVLPAVGLKISDAMEWVIQYFFPARPIFPPHCACGRAEIFRRFADVRDAALCFFCRLRWN